MGSAGERGGGELRLDWYGENTWSHPTRMGNPPLPVSPRPGFFSHGVTMPSPSGKQPTFEEALSQLEAIASAIEEGKIGLQDSITEYEKA